jgi:CheY-like chemotaxis protein
MATIILLEDNSELRLLLQQALELSDHVIFAGRTGLEGIELLENMGTIPDAIVCDVNMPEMDGITFIQYVRANPIWAHTYIVILSGREDNRTLAAECGADEYIQKPFSVLALTHLLDEHIASRS